MKQNYPDTLKSVRAVWYAGPDSVLYSLFYLYSKYGFKSGASGQQFSVKMTQSPLKLVASSGGFAKFAGAIALEIECLKCKVRESTHLNNRTSLNICIVCYASALNT